MIRYRVATIERVTKDETLTVWAFPPFHDLAECVRHIDRIGLLPGHISRYGMTIIETQITSEDVP